MEEEKTAKSERKSLVFPFHYGQEAESYTFYRVPKILFTAEAFDHLYAVTATQKAILKAFGMTATNVQKQANAISSDLARLEIEAFEKAAAAAAQN